MVGHENSADGERLVLDDAQLTLDNGSVLDTLTLAYRTYGTLNDDKSNAILICHALTGDHHPSGANPLTGRAGWWDNMVGPGKPIDTDRYSSSARMSLAAVQVPPARPASAPTARPMASTFRSSP